MPVFSRPYSDRFVGEWKVHPDPMDVPLYLPLSALDSEGNSDDTTYIQTTKQSDLYVAGFEPQFDPVDRVRRYQAIFRARKQGPETATATFSIYEGMAVIKFLETELTEEWVDYVLKLTADQKEALTNYQNWYAVVRSFINLLPDQAFGLLPVEDIETGTWEEIPLWEKLATLTPVIRVPQFPTEYVRSGLGATQDRFRVQLEKRTGAFQVVSGKVTYRFGKGMPFQSYDLQGDSQKLYLKFQLLWKEVIVYEKDWVSYPGPQFPFPGFFQDVDAPVPPLPPSAGCSEYPFVLKTHVFTQEELDKIEDLEHLTAVIEVEGAQPPSSGVQSFGPIGGVYDHCINEVVSDGDATYISTGPFPVPCHHIFTISGNGGIEGHFNIDTIQHFGIPSEEDIESGDHVLRVTVRRRGPRTITFRFGVGNEVTFGTVDSPDHSAPGDWQTFELHFTGADFEGLGLFLRKFIYCFGFRYFLAWSVDPLPPGVNFPGWVYPDKDIDTGGFQRGFIFSEDPDNFKGPYPKLVGLPLFEGCNPGDPGEGGPRDNDGVPLLSVGKEGGSSSFEVGFTIPGIHPGDHGGIPTESVPDFSSGLTFDVLGFLNVRFKDAKGGIGPPSNVDRIHHLQLKSAGVVVAERDFLAMACTPQEWDSISDWSAMSVRVGITILPKEEEKGHGWWLVGSRVQLSVGISSFDITHVRLEVPPVGPTHIANVDYIAAEFQAVHDTSVQLSNIKLEIPHRAWEGHIRPNVGDLLE